MKMLQRYIMGELLRVFLLLIIVLTVMLVFLGVFREAAERGLGPVQILQILPFIVPSMLPFTIPATLLLSVCVVYGRLSGDLEVIAAKAAGISALQLLAPAFVLGTVLTVGSFGLTNYAIPWAMANIERIVTQALEDIFLDVLASQHFYSDAHKGYSINVHDVKDRTLLDATFRYRMKSKKQITVRAESAKLKFDLENRQINLHLTNWKSSLPGSDSEGEMDNLEIPLPMPQNISKVKARNMTMASLSRRIEECRIEKVQTEQQYNQEVAMLLMTGEFHELVEVNQPLNKIRKEQAEIRHDDLRCRTEIHARFSMAFSCLFFAFIGGPFSMLQARRQFITTFIMCFLPILLVYYPVMFLMVNLSKNGTVEPYWAMWIPNAILALVGAWVLKKVVQH
ncbi:MAG: LptF/LptG family permease [Planctomycetota bacterium]